MKFSSQRASTRVEHGFVINDDECAWIRMTDRPVSQKHKQRDLHGKSSAIDCRNVWKIFGNETASALAAVRNEGLSKSQVLEEYSCVLGVADVSFTVDDGEIFCIMGLSGSGKSTLVRLINRLIEPSVGEIFVLGEDILRKRPTEVLRLRSDRIGMVFQNSGLMPHRTVRENVAFGLEIKNVRKSVRYSVADEMLAMFRLAEWGDRYPDELSGGMQQRVGFARALATDPSILLMDEPFSALDPLIRRELQDQFLELSKKMRKTTLFITHDFQEAIRLGDRIAIMKDGRFLQVGTPEQIVLSPANTYVEEFVKGISVFNLIRAHQIMEPIGASPTDAQKRDWPKASPQATLSELVDLVVETDNPILIVDDYASSIGVVTKLGLFRAMQREK